MSERKNIGRLGQVALTALCLGVGTAAFTAWPLGNFAAAKNSDHGGQGADHGGGHGGGNAHDNNGSHGNSGNSGGSGGGNGGGNGKSADRGPSDNAKPGSTDTDNDTDVSDDDSMKPHGLGKLNGFFHASDMALEHASPNSSIGRIADAFGAALSDYAKAQQEQAQPPSDGTETGDTTTTTDTTTPTGPTAEELGAILAGATNKPVTAAQVQAIAARLAELHPENEGLADFAANADDQDFQDIADAANAARTGADTTTDDDTSTSDGSTTDDTTTDGTTTTTTVVTE